MYGTLTYRIAADTHPGMVRSGNEDRFGVFGSLPQVDAAFVVADGMGGLAAGERAAAAAVTTIEATLRERLAQSGADPLDILRESLSRANDAVVALSRPAASDDTTQNPAESRGAEPASSITGTTAVAGIIQNGTLYLAHAGDSRAYRFRQSRLERLTDDHSFVAEQVKAGNMTEAEARKSRYRNVITRAIGIDNTVVPDIRAEPLAAGDLIMICSDGLTTMLEDDEIAPLLDERKSPESLVKALIDAANKRGGTDNTTVLVLKAEPSGASAPTPIPSVAPMPVSDRSQSRSRPSRSSESGWEPEPSRGSRRSSRRGGGTSAGVGLLAAIGAIALAATAAIALSNDLRDKIAHRLAASGGATTSAGDASGNIDLANLAYDPPREFAPDYLARGDRLAWAPGIGLVFVTQSTGKITLLSKTGDLLGYTYELPPATLRNSDPGVDEVYLAADAQGNIYLSFTRRRVIEKYSKERRLLARIGPEVLTRPQAIAVDEAGNIYVVDTNHLQVLTAHPRPAATPTPAASPKATTSPNPSASSKPGARTSPKPIGR